MQIALFCNIAQNIRGSQSGCWPMETFANDGNHSIVQQQCVDKLLCLHTFDIVSNCNKNNNNLKMILKLPLGSFPCPTPPHPLDLGTPTRVIALRHRCKRKTILQTQLLCSSDIFFKKTSQELRMLSWSLSVY